MSDVIAAAKFVMHQEDSTMSGKVTNDSRDSGGRTRFGIAERSHPELTSTGFFDSLGVDAALGAAAHIYECEYAVPLMLEQVNDQKLANALLSFAINEGVGSSVKVLQNALRAFDSNIVIDGKFGPSTLHLVNSNNPSEILKILGVFQRQHYTDIVAANPKNSAFLNGWINRVKANCG